MSIIPISSLTYQFFSWDWKEAPEWDEINEFISGLKEVHFYPIKTNSDDHTVLVINRSINKEQLKLLTKEFNNQS